MMSELKPVQVIDSQIMIENVSDALDLMANAESTSLVIHEQSLPAGFFDLKTGLAGDILQKFVQYGMRIAIVGDFERYDSKSLNAFIFECNRGRSIFFVENVEMALERLDTTTD